MTAVAPPLPAPAPMRRRISAFTDRHRSLSVILGMSLFAALLPLVVLLPPFSNFSGQAVWVDGFINAGVFVLLALGLNIVVGLAGLLDLGYAAFFAIGAYTMAFAASPNFNNHVPFWVMLLIGALVAAVFGILLGAPTLRLRGDYLAIVTLGFGEIVPVLFRNARKYTQGPGGIGGIDSPRIADYVFPIIGNPWPYYVTMTFLIIVTMISVYRLQDSRLGRSWMAIREDELAAAASGINTVVTKLLAFALGASTAGHRRRVLRQQAHPREPGPLRIQRVLHDPGHGRAGRHGQRLGCRARCLHPLRDPERAAEAAQPVLRQRRRRFRSSATCWPRSTSSSTSSCSTASRSSR